MADEERGEQQVEIRGPGGMGINFRGSNVLLMVALIIVLVSSILAFGLYQHELSARDRQIEMLKTADDQKTVMKELTLAVKKQESTQEALIYVMTLKAEEREALRLTQPERLKEMRR